MTLRQRNERDIAESVASPFQHLPAVCGYCDHSVRRVWFTGRRWVCAKCWRETFNEDPE